MPLIAVNVEGTALIGVLERLVDAVNDLRLAIVGPQPDESGPPAEGSLEYLSGDRLTELRREQLTREIRTLSPDQQKEFLKGIFQ